MTNSRRYGVSLATILILMTFVRPTWAAAVYSITDLGPSISNQYEGFNPSGQIMPLTPGSAVRSRDGQYSISFNRADGGSGPLFGSLSTAGQPTITLNSPVGDPAYQQVWPSAVNLSGSVVGTETRDVSGDGLGFVYTKAGGMQAVPFPNQGPGIYGSLSSINDAGLIVGTYESGLGSPKYPDCAFISDGHTSTDLNTLIAPGSGWLLTSATDINDLGQILGEGVNPQGRTDYFLLTPVPAPEPGTWLVLGAGIAGLGCRRMIGRR